MHAHNLSVITVSDGSLTDLRETLESMRVAGFAGRQIIKVKRPLPELGIDTQFPWSIEISVEEDSGPFDAMNQALALVETEYVMFMNSGDRFLETVDFDSLIHQLWRSPERWLVGRAMSTRDRIELGLWPHPNFARWQRSLGWQSWNHQSTIYEVSALRQVGGFRGGFATADWSTAMILEREVGQPLKLDVVIAYFDVTGMSSTMSKTHWVRDHALSRQAIDPKFGLRWWTLYYFASAMLFSLAKKGSRAKQLLFKGGFLRTAKQIISGKIRPVEILTITLSRHKRTRKVVLGILRLFGIETILRRYFFGGPKPLLQVNDPDFSDTSAEPRPISRWTDAADHYSTVLIIDDLICQLAPDRGIERFWISLLEAIRSIRPDVRVEIISRTGRLDHIGHLVYPFQLFDEKRLPEDLIELSQVPSVNHGNTWFASTYYTTLNHAEVSQICVVHDLIPEVFYWDTPSEIWEQRRKSFREADLTIAMSSSTFRDFGDYYPEQKHSCNLINMPVDRRVFYPRSEEEQEKALFELGITTHPFVLYVGSRAFYKEGSRLLWLAKQKKWTGGLVLVGGEPIKNTKKWTWVRPTDAQLAALYSAARATIVTSTYEGYGFPLTESLSCGTPVISRENSSLREASLGLGIYVNDFDLKTVSASLAYADKLKSAPDFQKQIDTALSGKTWDNFAIELVAMLDKQK